MSSQICSLLVISFIKYISHILPKISQICNLLVTSVKGFPAKFPFLDFWFEALRQNFPLQSATLFRTGPVLLKEVVIQFPNPDTLSFISWEYLGRNSHLAILVDHPGNSDWNDKQDVR